MVRSSIIDSEVELKDLTSLFLFLRAGCHVPYMVIFNPNKMEKEELVKSLVKDGYLVSEFHQSGEPADEKTIVLEVGNHFEEEAKKLVEKYQLKGCKVWFPKQDTCIDMENGLCQDGGCYPDECDLFL
jgi:hypothetical protein